MVVGVLLGAAGGAQGSVEEAQKGAAAAAWCNYPVIYVAPRGSGPEPGVTWAHRGMCGIKMRPPRVFSALSTGGPT